MIGQISLGWVEYVAVFLVGTLLSCGVGSLFGELRFRLRSRPVLWSMVRICFVVLLLFAVAFRVFDDGFRLNMERKTPGVWAGMFIWFCLTGMASWAWRAFFAGRN